MESKVQLTSNYIALLDQIRNLFTRQYLCNNTYFFKHIKHNLTIPLFLIAEERRIAAITNNQQEILQALHESGLVKVLNNRQISIIEYPTIKISTKNEQIFQQLKQILKEQNKKYGFSQRIQKEYINLTLYEQNPSYLEQLMINLNKNIEFQKVNLFDDIKLGTARIKKLKQEYIRTNGSNNNYGRNNNKYSLDKPPNIFIRRAMESDDEDQDRNKQKNGNDRKKKYKQVFKEEKKQPKFSQEDFPSLN